jgi:hypothetical protein
VLQLCSRDVRWAPHLSDLVLGGPFGASDSESKSMKPAAGERRCTHRRSCAVRTRYFAARAGARTCVKCDPSGSALGTPLSDKPLLQSPRYVFRGGGPHKYCVLGSLLQGISAKALALTTAALSSCPLLCRR